MEDLYKWSKLFFLTNILLLFFIYDFIVKVLISFFNLTVFYNYAIVLKAFIIIIAIILFGFKSVKKPYLYSFIALSIAFLIAKVPELNSQNINDINFNGYYYLSSVMPIVFIAFCSNYNNSILNKQIDRFLIFMGLSSIFVFVGYFLELDMFRSYFRGYRFGYSGFLLYHHEAGFIYFIAFNLVYQKLKRKKDIKNLVIFLLLFISSFFIGTKKTLFFMIISLMYFFIDNLKNKKQLIYSIILLLIVTIAFIKPILNVFNKFYELFYNIYIEKGFWSMFLSYRNDLLFNNLFVYIEGNITFQNVMFGWPLFRDFRSELELFDLFLFFGLIGVLTYFYLFKHLINTKNININYFILSLILGTFFSGNLFASVNVMVLIFVSVSYLNKITNESNKR